MFRVLAWRSSRCKRVGYFLEMFSLPKWLEVSGWLGGWTKIMKFTQMLFIFWWSWQSLQICKVFLVWNFLTPPTGTLFRDAFPCYFFVKFFSRCILEKQMPRICQFGWVFRLENWVQPALNWKFRKGSNQMTNVATWMSRWKLGSNVGISGL